jgi:signal transduction histidine kinase
MANEAVRRIMNLNKFLDVGFKPDFSAGDLRRLRLSNLAAYIGINSILLYNAIYIYLGIRDIFLLINLAFLGMLAGVILLNRLHKFSAARHLLMVSISTSIVTAISFGISRNGLEYYFFLFALVPGFIFPPRDKLMILIYVSLNLLLFAVFSLIGSLGWFPPLAEVEQARVWMKPMSAFTSAGTAAFIIYASQYFFEQKEIELEQAKITAEKATLLKDKFLSLVSHDMRGPLGAIQGYMSLATLAESTAEDIQKFSKESHEAATRLLEMIDNLLNITRLQTGSIVPVREKIDLRLMVTECILQLHYAARKKGIELNNLVPDGETVWADRHLLSALFFNLLHNAMKFTPGGGKVEVFMEKPGTYFVKDTGIGIPPNIVDKIFKHEEKTSRPGTNGEQGTGLGLPYCHDIVEAHGGAIKVLTGPDGTAFEIYLPPAES